MHISNIITQCQFPKLCSVPLDWFIQLMKSIDTKSIYQLISKQLYAHLNRGLDSISIEIKVNLG